MSQLPNSRKLLAVSDCFPANYKVFHECGSSMVYSIYGGVVNLGQRKAVHPI